MKLENFSVTFFRSIKSAEKINLSDLTVIIGANNEGKSNILRALQIAFSELQKASFHPARTRLPPSREDVSYDWVRDFPISLQERRTNKQSIFRLLFGLDDDECQSFKSEVGSTLNGNLLFEIRIGETNVADVKVVKSGSHAEVFKSKKAEILKFLRGRIDFTYISAVRTEDDLIDVIHRQLYAVVRSIEDDPEFKDAMQVISRIQMAKFRVVAERLISPLRNFIPEISNIEITSSQGRRVEPLRSSLDLIIDDGVRTSIDQKGDGIKSLAAIALLNQIRPTSSTNIVAIEEPEAHLHAGAIHNLRGILERLSSERQVIVSTHNPIFANRSKIDSNIIVQSGKARPAKNLTEIRDALGVRVTDNLQSAECVLLVEGECDRKIVGALFQYSFPMIHSRVVAGELLIENMRGASKLRSKLEHYRQSICGAYALLDNDQEGRAAFSSAEAIGLAHPSNFTLTVCKGMQNSELEDCIDPTIYASAIEAEYAVRLRGQAFQNSRRKWSERIADVFADAAKPFSEKIMSDIKTIVANETCRALRDRPESVLDFAKASPLISLKDGISRLLQIPQPVSKDRSSAP